MSPSTCRPGTARRSNPRTSGAHLIRRHQVLPDRRPAVARSAAGDRSGRHRVRRARPESRNHADPNGRVLVRQHDRTRIDRKLENHPHASLQPARRRPALQGRRQRRRPAAEPDLRSRRPAAGKTTKHPLLRIGLVGKAKISTPPRTLWARLVRYLSHTFNFEL